MEQCNAVGRRKTAVARVHLSVGKGKIEVNKKPLEDYFPLEVLKVRIKQQLLQVADAAQYDMQINVQGGGIRGQAEAIRLAIARALCLVDPSYRPDLKRAGYLTRDPRMVERKKYGQKKARKRFQFSKR